MVGVAVEAVLVIGDDDVGAVMLDESAHCGRRFVNRRCPKRTGPVVAGPSHHPGVAVSEELEMVNTVHPGNWPHSRCLVAITSA